MFSNTEEAESQTGIQVTDVYSARMRHVIGLITRGIRHVSRWLGGVGVQVQDLEKYLALLYKNIWHVYLVIHVAQEIEGVVG